MTPTTFSFRSCGMVQTQSGTVSDMDLLAADDAAQTKFGWQGLKEVSRRHIAYYLDGRQTPHPLGQQGRLIESVWEIAAVDDTERLSQLLQSL